MKVLWFTNTPSLASKALGKQQFGGGWIESLESAVLQYSKISLAVSFFATEKLDWFENNQVKYYPICNNVKNGKIQKWGERLWFRVPLMADIESMRKVIEDFKPDVIHIHGTERHFGYILAHINLPTVISIQGNLTVYSFKYFSGIPKKAFIHSLKLKDFYELQSPVFLHKRMEKQALMERDILNKCAYIAGRTRWDEDIARVLAPKANYFILNEILRKPFYGVMWNKVRTSKIMIITTSSNSAYKGFEVVLQTASLLKAYGLDFEWKVAGLLANNKNVTTAQKWCGIKSEDVHVKLLGSLTAEILVTELLKSDIYVQVSHIENSPNSVCEAMLTGMPVVASFAGGTSSLIDDNITGILYQDGDYYSLAGIVLKLIGDEGFCKNLGNAAHVTANKRHNAENVANEAIAIYNKLKNI